MGSFSCFLASFLVLFFHYPFGSHFLLIFIDFGSHFGIIFATFSNILEMCWEGFPLESQPLRALSGGTRFHTFSHHFSHLCPDPCFSHFFLNFGFHFGYHFGAKIAKSDNKKSINKTYLQKSHARIFKVKRATQQPPPVLP